MNRHLPASGIVFEGGAGRIHGVEAFAKKSCKDGGRSVRRTKDGRQWWAHSCDARLPFAFARAMAMYAPVTIERAHSTEIEALALARRSGWPEDLRVLLDRYPRERWDAHANLGEMARFWLSRHAMFRELSRDD